MGKGGHSHRSTLKNDHKRFKSKHSTKGQLKKQFKGKVEKGASGNGKAIRQVTKAERRNLSNQIKQNKILESKMHRKLFEGNDGVERIVTILALNSDIKPEEIAEKIVAAEASEGEMTENFEHPSVSSIKINRFKGKMKIIIPDHSDLLAILDACRVSDFVVFGLSAVEEVAQDFGEQILRAITAQGVATPVGVMPNLVSNYPKKNLQDDVRQSLLSYFTHFFPGEDKIYALENSSDSLNCLRFLSQKLPKSITWRDSRGYLIADKVFWSTDNPAEGNLVVEGITRGIGFNANRLVHIPGLGDFQIDHIEREVKAKSDDTSNTFTPDSMQDTLEELNQEEVDMGEEDDFDEMDEEYGVRMDGKTYFETGDDNITKPKKLPKGTSEYQARWYIDDDYEDSDLESQDEDEQSIAADDVMMDNDTNNNGSEFGATEPGDMESEMFIELSPEEEEKQLQEFRSLEKDDLEFPDEFELEPTENARETLATYRGVKSLGTCEWDVDEKTEDTPSIWKRLLRIFNYKATRNRILKEEEKTAQVKMGDRIRIHLKAPSFILERINPQRSVFVAYELLQHEHKLGVTNFSFESWENYDKPIPSGEYMIAQYGPRRQVIKPTFSQASNHSNNVHKLERFAHHGATSIATAIAPVLFSNAPTIFFKMRPEGGIELVGQGTFLNCDHTRIIAKRRVLTGEPVKIHKRLITIRYMFFNAEDINWFKAVPLFTKSGRTGFIKESLGTHGYFKATFDGRLTSQDVVAMSLYTRVWPELSTMWTQ